MGVDDNAFCAYLGPNIRGVIQRNTIYEGTRDKVLQQLSREIERYPRIATLIVSGETFVEDRVKAKTPGNYLYEENRRFISELKKEGGNHNG